MTTSSYDYKVPPPKVGMKFRSRVPSWGGGISEYEITRVYNKRIQVTQIKPERGAFEDYNVLVYYTWRCFYDFTDPKEPFTDKEYNEIFV